MKSRLELVNSDRTSLLLYLERQLQHFFPDGLSHSDQLKLYLDPALLRLEHCINAVKFWPENRFDYLHSTQYTIFLYFLANTIWREQGDIRLCTKLFYLNKALNGIDLFYEIAMPEIFFIGHSVGIVLAKATYSDYLVLYQNSTVGKNHGIAPVLGSGVIMYPNSAIIGRCQIAQNTVVAQGVSVINQDTVGDSMVFQAEAGKLVHKPLAHHFLSDFFRI